MVEWNALTSSTRNTKDATRTFLALYLAKDRGASGASAIKSAPTAAMTGHMARASAHSRSPNLPCMVGQSVPTRMARLRTRLATKIAAQRIVKDHGQSSASAPPRAETVSQSASIVSPTRPPMVAKHAPTVTQRVTPRPATTQPPVVRIALVTSLHGRHALRGVVVVSRQPGSSST